VNNGPVARVRRIMPAAPDVVFDEWLDPESLKEWMCPRPAQCAVVKLEPRVGGVVRFDIEDSGTRLVVTGQFLEIDRPRRLRFTWSSSVWPDPMVASIVTVTFEPVGEDETLMSIEHSLLPPDLVDTHQNGWTKICDQLAGALLGT
jgi:uncharacterized protein YndB with AHSA1/START domain